MEKKLYYETEEVCELLRISPYTLKWWIEVKREIYPYLTKIGRRYVITPTGLMAYLNKEVS